MVREGVLAEKKLVLWVGLGNYKTELGDKLISLASRGQPGQHSHPPAVLVISIINVLSSNFWLLVQASPITIIGQRRKYGGFPPRWRAFSVASLTNFL